MSCSSPYFSVTAIFPRLLPPAIPADPLVLASLPMDYKADKDRQREWRAENSGAQKDPNYVIENEEEISYMFDDEATPVKAVGDMAYEVGHSGNLEKEDIECRETFSQMKRRRMLQFTNDDIDCNKY